MTEQNTKAGIHWPEQGQASSPTRPVAYPLCPSHRRKSKTPFTSPQPLAEWALRIGKSDKAFKPVWIPAFAGMAEACNIATLGAANSAIIPRTRVTGAQKVPDQETSLLIFVCAGTISAVFLYEHQERVNSVIISSAKG